MRRLFSTFAPGWPGVGLLLMRLVCGIALIAVALPLVAVIPNLLEIGVGVLLITGLWTPVAGSLVAIWEVWNLFSRQGDPWFFILVGTLGLALALLGPGAWSVDARLFGWKRIEVR